MTALPALNRLLASADRIYSRWPDAVGNPPESDRERLVQEVRERVLTDSWDGAKMYLVTSAARALFDEERRARPDLQPLREFYFDEIRASTRSGFLNAIFAVYLSTFSPGAQHTRQLAEALSRSTEHLGPRSRQIIDAVPIILDPYRAHEGVASLMSTMADPWTELKQLGLRKPHDMGLMAEAHLAFVDHVRPGLKHRGEMERLIGWLKPERHEAKVSGASEAIEGLLDHWRLQAPPPDDLRYLTENLVSLYGDPRVTRSSAWMGVTAETMAVFMRWLTGENIRFFLDVVSAVESSHMWEPRRKFWLGLHRQGRIDAAWVAFSDKGWIEASKRTSGSRATGRPGYGSQSARGSRLDTSLLILQIGRKTVVEGSHNYMVHIFDQSNQKAPVLYQPAYDCEAIRLTPGAKAKSHLGYWEGWVMENI
ncbi:EH signature domain-containing protein [Rhizobium sp. SG741]|uniref:EH signature domain-containing protein n=1 Tax=Rhizobium sp. SG741 TaxID=2587114 RepID=UPI0014484C5C|nr:EH signature domain-containing protein [Rhizobium sp. SG741]